MKTETVRQVNYGHACQNCKLYFVTADPLCFTCPWCKKAESGAGSLDLYASIQDPNSEIQMVGMR